MRRHRRVRADGQRPGTSGTPVGEEVYEEHREQHGGRTAPLLQESVSERPAEILSRSLPDVRHSLLS